MKKILIYILLSIIISISTMGTMAFAQAPGTPSTGNTQVNPFQPTLIPKPDYLPGPNPTSQEAGGGTRKILTDTILPRYTIMLIGFVGSLALIYLVIGGVRFATAYGNDEATQKAKEQVIYALIAFILALLSYAIITIVINLKFEGNTTQLTPAPPRTGTENVPGALPKQQDAMRGTNFPQ